MDLSADILKVAYYVVGVIFVALLGWSGWRQGFARQAMTLIAIACAWAAAYYGGSSAAPVFAFLKYPKPILLVIGATAVGGATFLGVHGLRRWFLKRTVQQNNPRVRLSYGILGAILGVMFGSLLFILTTVFLTRAVGAAAKSNIDDHERKIRGHVAVASDDPGSLVRNFAKLGSALDEGLSGKFVRRYDDTSMTHLCVTIGKVTIMMSNSDSVDRFLSYPGVDKLTSHPKLVAVKDDPEVFRLLMDRSFASLMKLIRNDKVLSLASDTEFKALMEKMEFEKALNFALKPDGQSPALAPLPPLPPIEAPAAPEAR